jgi:hypothetical protein
VAAAAMKRLCGCHGTTAQQILLLEIQQEDFFIDNQCYIRQQTTTVDYKRLITGFVLIGFAFFAR